MSDLRLGVVEGRFADIIWKNEPLSSGELVKLCEEQLNWKKSTTYTVLKKLCERGIFINENGTVKALISRERYKSLQSTQVVDEDFGGSLPGFVAAFTANRRLSEAEVRKLRQMIDSYTEAT